MITAKCGNYKATCKITVKKPSVKASASAKTVFVGGTSQIKVKKTGVSGKVTYTSSNKSVAVVSAGGKVTAKKQEQLQAIRAQRQKLQRKRQQRRKPERRENRLEKRKKQ